MSTEADAIKSKSGDNGWEPNILAFCCNWCSYAGADLAGVSRFQYPPTVKILRVMCSSRVEPAFILKALKDGADGVLIAGCHIGDCHYIDGNKNAEVRINNTKKALAKLGFDKRLRLEWVSASEGLRFSQVIKEFTEEIKKLGQNPVKIDIKPQMNADERRSNASDAPRSAPKVQGSEVK